MTFSVVCICYPPDIKNLEDNHEKEQHSITCRPELKPVFASYGTEEQCEAVIEKSRWPDGYRCPKCNCAHPYVYLKNAVKTYQCSDCRKQVSLTEVTIFHSTKLTLIKWFQAMFFMSQNKNNISALELKGTWVLAIPQSGE